MASEQLKNILDNITPQGENVFLEPATAEQIDCFEKKHEIVLPKQYKEWLQVSDGAEFFLPAGVQLYGVAHKPLIDVDDDDRPSETFTVIGALATGDPVLFKKETISIYNHQAGRIEEDETYEDFYSFLSDLPDMLGIGG